MLVNLSSDVLQSREKTFDIIWRVSYDKKREVMKTNFSFVEAKDNKAKKWRYGFHFNDLETWVNPIGKN